MEDIFQRIYKNKGPLGQWSFQAEGNYIFPKLKGAISNHMEFEGKKMITWSINDYLGLANHPEVRKVDSDVAAEYGAAYPMGARMMSGHTDFHEELECQLADFSKKETSYLLNFGYQGFMSVIDTLVSKDDIIIYDIDSHACIIDGVRLHMGKRFTFKHNDIESLEHHLKRATKKQKLSTGGILVITEGVFGMRGDQGKLKEIVALKKKYNFRLLVDDAHGFGTLGETGSGTGEEQGVQNQIDVYMATFAKSMAGIGAFVSSSKEVIDFLRYNMRSQMFAKALPTIYVKGALKRLELIRNRPEIKAKLWENVNNLQSGLRKRDFDLGETNTCVTPVYLKASIPEAMSLVNDLRKNHAVFCSIVTYPVIPKGLLLLRLIPTANHTQQDIDITLNAFSIIREKLQKNIYKNTSEEVTPQG